jgi:hypothetical protein
MISSHIRQWWRGPQEAASGSRPGGGRREQVNDTVGKILDAFRSNGKWLSRQRLWRRGLPGYVRSKAARMRLAGPKYEP